MQFKIAALRNPPQSPLRKGEADPPFGKGGFGGIWDLPCAGAILNCKWYECALTDR